MKTLLALLLLIPSINSDSFASEEIIIKCKVEWLYDLMENKVVEDFSLESRAVQIKIYEPNTAEIKVQHTNELWWDGVYSPDLFYASHEDPEDINIKFKFTIKIDRLTGEYNSYKYTDIKATNDKYGFHEFGFCNKSSKML